MLPYLTLPCLFHFLFPPFSLLTLFPPPLLPPLKDMLLSHTRSHSSYGMLLDAMSILRHSTCTLATLQCTMIPGALTGPMIQGLYYIYVHVHTLMYLFVCYYYLRVHVYANVFGLLFFLFGRLLFCCWQFG